MTKKAKKVPDFKSEDAERRFWATHDSSDYVDWGGAQPVRLADQALIAGEAGEPAADDEDAGRD